MTEPPRPPGEGNPYAANDPTSGSTPPPSSPPPPPPGGGYGPPPGGYNAPPGGYNPPPGGGYNPPPQQFGYNQPPAGGVDDRNWVLITHFGGAAGAFISGGVAGWIAPLVALLARGNQSPYVRSEAVKALNFQILWSIVGFIGYATWCIGIGFLITAAAWLIGTIFGIIAGAKANNNEPYNYPLSVQMIK